MSAKLITVFGATGAQGSSVLRSLSQNTTTPFTLRGTTRNSSSASSKTLLKQVPRLDLVQADGWDKASMVAAFRGSKGAFVNTNSDDSVFDDPSETRTEVDLGKIVVEAAIEAGVEILVYSGATSATKTSGGKVANPTFDDKYAIGEYAKSTGAFKAVVIVGAGSYFENFLSRDLAPIFGGFPYNPSEDGTLVLRIPSWGGKEEVPFISIEDDFGDIVHGVFLEPENYTGKLVQAVSDIRSYAEVVAAFEKTTGRRAEYEEVPKWQDLDVYGVRALENVKLIFGFCQASDGRYYGDQTDSSTARELKRNVANASRRSGSGAVLRTLEGFFAQHFGGE